MGIVVVLHEGDADAVAQRQAVGLGHFGEVHLVFGPVAVDHIQIHHANPISAIDTDRHAIPVRRLKGLRQRVWFVAAFPCLEAQHRVSAAGQICMEHRPVQGIGRIAAAVVHAQGGVDDSDTSLVRTGEAPALLRRGQAGEVLAVGQRHRAGRLRLSGIGSVSGDAQIVDAASVGVGGEVVELQEVQAGVRTGRDTVFLEEGAEVDRVPALLVGGDLAPVVAIDADREAVTFRRTDKGFGQRVVLVAERVLVEAEDDIDGTLQVDMQDGLVEGVDARPLRVVEHQFAVTDTDAAVAVGDVRPVGRERREVLLVGQIDGSSRLGVCEQAGTEDACHENSELLHKVAFFKGLPLLAPILHQCLFFWLTTPSDLLHFGKIPPLIILTIVIPACVPRLFVYGFQCYRCFRWFSRFLPKVPRVIGSPLSPSFAIISGYTSSHQFS